MDEPARRRPRSGPPAPPEAPPGPAEPPPDERAGRGRITLGTVAWGGLAVVVAVIVVAFATGTADDLPWGAIIGVVAVLAFGLVAARRRAALRGGEDDGP